MLKGPALRVLCIRLKPYKGGQPLALDGFAPDTGLDRQNAGMRKCLYSLQRRNFWVNSNLTEGPFIPGLF